MKVARLAAVMRLLALALPTFVAASLVIACSSSSTSKATSSGGDGGGSGGEGGGGDGGGGALTCKVAAGTYTVHSTAKDLADGGFGCQEPPDQTVTYPQDPSADAGLAATCTATSDMTTCTTTVTCSSMSGSISSKSTTVTKINSDGNGYTVTQTQEVTSNGVLSTDCVITSTATPK